MDVDADDLFKEGTKVTGTCTWEWPFSVKVTKRKGDSVQGTIKWDLQDSETKFKVKKKKYFRSMRSFIFL